VWDETSFHDVIHLIAPHADRTLFAGVRQVPPGHMLIASRFGVRVERYWDFDYPLTGAEDPVDPTDDHAAIVAFRETLDEAVRLRLHADVPVAVYLSGGLDSCALLGLAARHAPRPLTSFTLGFEHAAYDETEVAREMAAHAGATFTPVRVTAHDLAGAFEDAVCQAETVVRNPNAVAKYLLSRAVRDAGFKVVLTGEGSDEILAGYPSFRRDLVFAEEREPAARARRIAELGAQNEVSRGLTWPDADTNGLDSVAARLGFAPTFLEAFSTTAARLAGLLSTPYSARFTTRDAYAAFIDSLDVEGQLRGRHPVNQAMYVWSKGVLPNVILAILGDRMEMGHSIEGRVPMLDTHVVERARALPMHLKIRGATEKYILREAARDVLPPSVYRRQKHPFLAPPTAAASVGPLAELVQDTLRGPDLADLPFFDRRRVVALLDGLAGASAAERRSLDPLFLVLTSACFLQRRYALAGAPQLASYG
jgi:asparagine synthase (glutamine-hydrolysing)